MASSKRPEPDWLLARTARLLKAWIRRDDRLCVGLSGGLDSVVLLDVLSRLRAELGVELFAVHVNHQLSPRAQAWSEFCHALCHRLGVACHVEPVAVVGDAGLGLEAAARRARYEVFHRQPAEYLALAHHLDDQAETVLLQLLRGAGVKGLAAMPFMRSAPDSIRRPSAACDLAAKIIRPFLAEPRASLAAYAERRGLCWIEDESNRSLKFDRNYLRHAVTPRLDARFPSYRATLARSARHCAEAAQLLEELAAIDLAALVEGEALNLSKLGALSPLRAKNALRGYFHSRALPQPDAEQLEQMIAQLALGRHDALACVQWSGHAARRHGERLWVERVQAQPASTTEVTWHGEASLSLPGVAGVVAFAHASGRGIGLARLRGGALTLKRRAGGERLRPQANRPRRTLKNLLQERGVPHWRRKHLPLLFCGERLVWAGEIGVECEFQAQAGEEAIEVTWLPHAEQIPQ